MSVRGSHRPPAPDPEEPSGFPYADVLQHAADGIAVICAATGAIIYVNDAWSHALGYPPGELAGRHVSLVNAPSDRLPQELAGEMLKILDRGGSWRGELELRRRDGSTVWWEQTVSRYDDALGRPAWIVVGRDVGARRAGASELAKAEHRFRTAFDALPVAAALTDEEGRLVAVNGALATLTDTTREELLGPWAGDRGPSRRLVPVPHRGSVWPGRTRPRRGDGDDRARCRRPSAARRRGGGARSGVVVDVVADRQREPGRHGDQTGEADGRPDRHERPDDLVLGGAGGAREVDGEPARVGGRADRQQGAEPHERVRLEVQAAGRRGRHGWIAQHDAHGVLVVEREAPEQVFAALHESSGRTREKGIGTTVAAAGDAGIARTG
jgi:PAS domain S-box-containing protein